MPARLRPTAPIAADAILVGDPGRALMLAQELLEQPKMSNHARGLWGYSGTTHAGRELTIQATGMGGPSARVVLADLAELGVRQAVRIGTATAVAAVALGEILIVEEARELRGSFVVDSPTKEPRNVLRPDPGLAARLREALPEAPAGRVASLDRLHRDVSLKGVADVADMQTAALIAAADELGVALAALLVVTETSDGLPLGDEELEAAAKRAGRAATAALSA